MRRALPILLIAGLAVAACGSSEPEAGSGASPDTATSQPDTATSTPTDSSAPAITPPAAPACIPDGGEAPEPDFGEAGPPPTSPDKPDVELPAELPTEREFIDSIARSGRVVAAADLELTPEQLRNLPVPPAVPQQPRVDGIPNPIPATRTFPPLENF